MVRLNLREGIVKNLRSRLVKFNSAALAVLTTVFLVSGGASAKNHKIKTSDNQADVVAHISFPGLSPVDMAMQKKVNDKYYLYVQHSKDEGISIIDISKPAQPKTVGVIPWPDPAVSGRMNVTGDLAIIAGTNDRPMRGNTSNDDLVLWDFPREATASLLGVALQVQHPRHACGVLQSVLCLPPPPRRQRPQRSLRLF